MCDMTGEIKEKKPAFDSNSVNEAQKALKLYHNHKPAIQVAQKNLNIMKPVIIDLNTTSKIVAACKNNKINIAAAKAVNVTAAYQNHIRIAAAMKNKNILIPGLIAANLNPQTIKVIQALMSNTNTAQLAFLNKINLKLIQNVAIDNTKLISSLMLPAKDYALFRTDTIKMMNEATDAVTKRKLYASIFASDAALFNANESVLKVLEFQIEQSKQAAAVKFNIPRVVRDDILLYPDSEINYESEQFINSLAPISYSVLARHTIDLWCECNDAAELYLKKTLFTPTSRTIKAVSNLLCMIAIDKLTFSQFILNLIYLIHESSDTRKPRYLIANGGTLDKCECSIIEHIKVIRNKALIHDIDQDSDARKQASWENLARTYRWLGVSGVSMNEEDYKKTQVKIMTELRDFLRLLRDSILAKSLNI